MGVWLTPLDKVVFFISNGVNAAVAAAPSQGRFGRVGAYIERFDIGPLVLGTMNEPKIFLDGKASNLVQIILTSLWSLGLKLAPACTCR